MQNKNQEEVVGIDYQKGIKCCTRLRRKKQGEDEFEERAKDKEWYRPTDDKVKRRNRESKKMEKIQRRKDGKDGKDREMQKIEKIEKIERWRR